MQILKSVDGSVLWLYGNNDDATSNISKTASFIGMERSALHRKLKQLGIKGIN